VSCVVSVPVVVDEPMVLSVPMVVKKTEVDSVSAIS